MARRTLEPAEEVNLIPVMNLVTLLIPFLLMSAQFVAYAVIDSTLPALCSVDCGQVEDEPVTVSLTLGAAGYRLVATGPGLDDFADGVDLACHTPGCEGDPEAAWDVAALREQLTRVKDRHPDHRSLVLTSEDGVPYKALVLAMDATREDPGQGSEASGMCNGRCLFPDVILAAAF